MRYLLLLFCLSAQANWQTNQFFYWFNNQNPSVAIATNVVHGIYHATGTVTAVSIGDQTGVLTNYCTGYTPPEVCGSVLNCTWPQDHKDVQDDTFLLITCRPVTNGITYVSANNAIGKSISWFSTVRRQWYSGTVTQSYSNSPASFGDGLTATYGVVWFQGTQAISGDSGSPVFIQNANGVDYDFCGSVNAIVGEDQTVLNFLYPSNASVRPSSTPTVDLPTDTNDNWEGIL